LSLTLPIIASALRFLISLAVDKSISIPFSLTSGAIFLNYTNEENLYTINTISSILKPMNPPAPVIPTVLPLRRSICPNNIGFNLEMSRAIQEFGACQDSSRYFYLQNNSDVNIFHLKSLCGSSTDKELQKKKFHFHFAFQKDLFLIFFFWLHTIN